MCRKALYFLGFWIIENVFPLSWEFHNTNIHFCIYWWKIYILWIINLNRINIQYLWQQNNLYLHLSILNKVSSLSSSSCQTSKVFFCGQLWGYIRCSPTSVWAYVAIPRWILHTSHWERKCKFSIDSDSSVINLSTK